MPKPVKSGEHRFYLDKRADQIAQSLPTDSEDSLLTTKETARTFGVSKQWLEIRRVKGGGPPFIKVSSRCVRYRSSDLRRWLEERVRQSTSDYSK